MRPGNRAVVHHVIVYTRPPAPAVPAAPAAPAGQPARRPAPLFTFAAGMDIPAGQTGGPQLPPDQRKPRGPNDRPAPRTLGPSIGAYVPGTASRVYQPDTAARLAAGSTLIFQMHYTTTGKATTDRTSIGLVFAKAPPKTELRSTALINGNLHIPAGAPDHRVDAEMTFNRDVTLWGMLPHTHVRGKRWIYEVTYPDGRKATILSVPKYDFEWQTDYVFKQPLKLPKGTTLHATAWYDNSPTNKVEPGSTSGRLVGRSDLGRNDVHRSDLQRRSGDRRGRSVGPKRGRTPFTGEKVRRLQKGYGPFSWRGLQTVPWAELPPSSSRPL